MNVRDGQYKVTNLLAVLDVDESNAVCASSHGGGGDDWACLKAVNGVTYLLARQGLQTGRRNASLSIRGVGLVRKPVNCAYLT